VGSTVDSAAAYRVLYDAGAAWFPSWWLAALGLVPALGGFLLMRGPEPAARARRAARFLGTICLVGGACWAIVLGVVLYAQHARLRAALRGGGYTTVEGVVHDVVAPGEDDYRGDSWLVESGPEAHWYPYALSRLSPGYRRPSPRGGGLRDGARVRIADVGGVIARLEVAR
jgi:hypothetical protein